MPAANWCLSTQISLTMKLKTQMTVMKEAKKTVLSLRCLSLVLLCRNLLAGQLSANSDFGAAMSLFSGFGVRCKRNGVIDRPGWGRQSRVDWITRGLIQSAGGLASSVANTQRCSRGFRSWNAQPWRYLLSPKVLKTAASQSKLVWPASSSVTAACAAPACPAGAKTPPQTKRVRRCQKYCQSNSTCLKGITL